MKSQARKVARESRVLRRGQTSERDLQARWDREYRALHVIPSSRRSLPAKALVLFEGLVDFASHSPVLDIGCGNGRNAIYLAGKGCLVEAVDASTAALEYVVERARQAGVLEQVNVRNAVLGTRWPYRSGEFGLALDAYVSCHLLDDQSRILFRDEVYRVLREGGIAICIGFLLDDEYYAAMPQAKVPNIVVDANNGIAKRLWSSAEAREFYGARFHIVYEAQFSFEDEVLGKAYRRSILSLVIKK